MEREKLTGDPKVDFPEMYENKLDNEDGLMTVEKLDAFYKQREVESDYVKKTLIEEVVENVEVRPDLSIYDKRLKRPLLKRIFDALFGDDRV
jgi:hypothetical protein